MDLSVAMCKAASLSLQAFEKGSHEISQTSQAVRSKIIFLDKPTINRCYYEFSQVSTIHFIQMPVRQLLQKQEKLRRGSWRGGCFLMHLLQRRHNNVLDVANTWGFRTLQS